MRASLDDLEREVATLGDLPREELAALWLKTYSCPAPKGVRRELLIRAAAWHLQSKRLGGLPATTLRLLKAAMNQADSAMAQRAGASAPRSDDDLSTSSQRAQPPVPARRLAPGTRLIREWNGRHHVVDVIEKGFVYEARTFSSLSAIARQITGAHWSGPRFFAVRTS